MTALLIGLGVVTLPSATAAVDGQDPAPVKTAKVREVGRIPVDAMDPEFAAGASVGSGWLILDPGPRRRGYTVYETGTSTVIRSFDLDTLQPRRSVKIPGVPLPAGDDSGNGGGTGHSGDVVHAVDSVKGRVYIAMSNTLNGGIGADTRRAFLHMLVLDEEAFDKDPTHAFGAFALPEGEAHLATHNLLGLVLTRDHLADSEAGKLVATFASPYLVSNAPVTGNPIPGPHHHFLVQWDPSQTTAGVPIATNQSAPSTGVVSSAPRVKEDWQRPLSACASAPMTSTGETGTNATYAKNFQWDILPTPDAVYVGCQSAPQSGAVARVALDPATGQPTAETETIYPLAKPISDVIADPGGGRLFVESFGGGATLWVFDTKTLRFSGSVAGTLEDGRALSAGVDPVTGRLYTLTDNFCVPRTGGGVLPVRGGLQVTEAGLDPVPAPENVAPELAAPSWWRIKVDPVTRRVYVRLGASGALVRLTHPGCRSVVVPPEPFYRVIEDRTPVLPPPDPLDDAAFTTDVDEEEGVTQASYLGSGSGFGTRAVLTRGLSAATTGVSDLQNAERSPCSRDDRELVAGSVEKVEVSDQSTAAEAAAMDADGRTQETAAAPFSRCKPHPAQADPGYPQYRQFDEQVSQHVKDCKADVDEGAFDERQRTKDDAPVDENEDGCDDRTGENLYAARCTEDDNTEGTSREGEHDGAAPRDGFKATTTCKAAHEEAEATSTAALALPFRAPDWPEGTPAEVQATPGPAVLNGLRVAKSSSTVTVTRDLGEGVTVRVDSVARGIEIPGVGRIGVVRAEATSTSTGRDGRAKGHYERIVCDVHLGGKDFSGCLSPQQQRTLVDELNERFSGRAQFRLRDPDEVLKQGTTHGYLAAVQRDRKELFGDKLITRDDSLAVPALEIMTYVGEGQGGAGRQVLQLAGVQASTSYGIACVNGQAADGQCSDGSFAEGDGPDVVFVPGDTVVETSTEEIAGATVVKRGGGILRRLAGLVKRIPQMLAEALRLLFNNPRELGLLATVWALLYGPCYLGERRRSISGLRARRAAVGGAG